jgi:plastocyanin
MIKNREDHTGGRVYTMKKALFLAGILLFLFAPTATAQNHDTVDTVILASAENYPDALVSAAASSKAGVPVLLTEKDELPDETADALQRFDPDEVVMVGGEAVISADVATTLERDHNVTRLWGVTRYGTAVDVADYFWPEGSDSAVIVENNFDDSDGEVLAQAQRLARQESDPVFLAPSEKIPASVLGRLDDLGVTGVTVVGRELSDEARQELTEINVSVDEEITGDSEEEVASNIHERATAEFNNSQPLHVVAAPGFKHSIASVNDLDSNAYLVGSDSESQGAVDFVTNRGVADVRVVGEPGLASDIAERLRQDTDADVRAVSVQPDQAASFSANISEREEERWKKRHQERREVWQQEREDRDDQMQENANRSLRRAEETIDRFNASGEAQDALSKAQVLYSDGKYFEAVRNAQRAMEHARQEHWEQIRDNRTAVRHEADDEVEDIRDKVNELREVNREVADEMQENMTVEERLEVIEEIRNERREVVKELNERATELKEDRRESLRERLREARRETSSDGLRKEAHLECSDRQAGSSDVEFKGEDGYLETEGVVSLSTPNYRPDVSVEEDSGANQVSVTIDLVQRDGFGVQCVGEAEFRVRKDVAPGNWTIDLTVNEDGSEIVSESGEVTVREDDDEREENTEEDRNSTGDVSDDGDGSSDTHVIEYTDNGFSPSRVEIDQGDTVVWRRSGGPAMWVASNQHPTHTRYHGTSTSQHCDDPSMAGDRFDACGAQQEYSFTFDKSGQWGYHNHRASYHAGTVVVEPE